jgi:NAD dependent epimerase/dehydratase family enzyme
MADAVLTGSRVSAQKILASGFEFQHPNLREAIQHLRTNRI